MIARVWSARATQARVPAYADHLKRSVLPSVREVNGYAGAMLLEKTTSGECEIVVITFWKSLEAIRGFAGADLERAVVTDEARSILTSFDSHVRHYDVALRDTIEEGL